MPKFTYMRRRQGGVYYLAIRLPHAAAAGSKLWRCSLHTRDHREARRRALAYLKWLIPMKDATTTEELIGQLIAQLDHFLLNRYAADANDVRQRTAFLKRLLAYVLEWQDTRRDPVKDRAILEAFGRLREGAAILNVFLPQDMVRFGVHSYDESPLANWSPPQIAKLGIAGPPDLPKEEVSVPGDSSHYWTMVAIRASGNDDEIVRDYFSRYRPEVVPLLDQVIEPEPVTWASELDLWQAERKLRDAPPIKFDALEALDEGKAAKDNAADIPVSIPAPANGRASCETPQSNPEPVAGLTLSQARDEFITLKKKTKRGRYVEEDAGLVIQFLIDFAGDIAVNALSKDIFREFESALMETPDRKGIPKEHTRSLYARYLYAQVHGFDQLKPISETRLKNVWYGSLHQFIHYLRTKVCDKIPDYRFTEVPDNAIEAKERDAWKNEELLKLYSLPLFTGCKGPRDVWRPGDKFVQNELYWSYVIIFATAMRNSEIGSLRTSNIVQDERGNWNFDLRPDKTEPNAKQQKRKTKASERVIPVPDMLIHLGLLERKAELEKAGISRLFPEWQDYQHPTTGRNMPGHHFSKSWQRVKKRFEFQREGLTIYGGRHTRASWYDALQFAERTRNRLLGHAAKTVANRYGEKNGLTPEEDDLVRRSRLPIEDQIAEILLIAKFRAEFRELEVVKTWLNVRPKLERKPRPDGEARPPAVS